MDLLSNLPDDVLCHILSFLTTKEAALTSILCKRWRNLIAYVPNLDIEDFVILDIDGHIRQLFMDFVDRVLALQGNSPIKKFSLNCIGGEVDSDRVDAWIGNVMVRGVSELELSILSDMESGDKYRLFPKKFESKKLVKLEIRYFDICWLDGSIFLPMLKTLVLHSLSLSFEKFEILLHALPTLEELVVRYISWKELNVADVIVSSASLKTLTIDSIGRLLDTYTFDTPSLVNLCYSDYVANDYSVAKMENLLEARITLWVTEDEIKRAREPNNDWLQDNVVLRFANVGKLMNGIRNVRYLKICPNTLEMVYLCCESMPVFNNLKSLTIENNMRRARQAWQAMPVLLRNCPHLKTTHLSNMYKDRVLYFEFMHSGSLAPCHRQMQGCLSLRFSRGQRSVTHNLSSKSVKDSRVSRNKERVAHDKAFRGLSSVFEGDKDLYKREWSYKDQSPRSV